MATEKRDLHSGNPIWNAAEADVLPAQKLTHNLRVDILIVGGGFTGSLIAENLAADFSVAVVDRRSPARGSTAASTGLLLYEIDTPLIKLRKQIGSEPANRAWLRSNAAMKALTQKIEALRIECDFRQRPGVYLPGDVLDADGLSIEAAARAEIGLPSYLIDRKELMSSFDLAGEAAIVSENTGECDPVKGAVGFFTAALQSGIEIYAETEIAEVSAGCGGVSAQTKSGLKIAAKHLVFASGYEIPEWMKISGHEIASTWAFATAVQPRLWPDSALVWEASDPYCYLRSTPDGRALIGGGDEDFDDEERRKKLTPEKTRMLQNKLLEFYPHLDVTPGYVWSGAFGTSDTGLPRIGPLPGFPNCHAVLGFGGNGMTYAMIAAQLIGRHVRGKSDPDADLFAFPAEAAVS